MHDLDIFHEHLTMSDEDRAEIEHLSGQRAVPILVLDDGEVVSSSGEIVRWAESHPRS